MKLLRKKTSKHVAAKKLSVKNIPRTYAHHWDHPKAYTIALLLVIGMLAAPIYTGFATKESHVQAAAPKDLCSDTDGRDYGMKGSVDAVSSGTSYSFDDACSGSVLKEYYCNGDRMASELKKCANGCSGGKCLP